MKNYNPLYYLLFILLVMGAFASMAQNSYGLKIIGGVAFSFSLLFLIRLIYMIRQREKTDFIAIAELVGLFLLSAILGVRVFYIYFPLVELLFTGAGALLMLVYLWKMIIRFRGLRQKNNWLALLISVFHISLILFLVSLVLAPIMSGVSSTAGTAAFMLLLIFVIAGLLKKDILVEGENITAFSTVRQFKDHSIVIMSLFLLFSLYVGFNRIGIIPGIYSDEFPQAYYRLVDDAAAGKEKPENGTYKHEVFKENYDQFVKRHGIKQR